MAMHDRPGIYVGGGHITHSLPHFSGHKIVFLHSLWVHLVDLGLRNTWVGDEILCSLSLLCRSNMKLSLLYRFNMKLSLSGLRFLASRHINLVLSQSTLRNIMSTTLHNKSNDVGPTKSYMKIVIYFLFSYKDLSKFKKNSFQISIRESTEN